MDILLGTFEMEWKTETHVMENIFSIYLVTEYLTFSINSCLPENRKQIRKRFLARKYLRDQ